MPNPAHVYPLTNHIDEANGSVHITPGHDFVMPARLLGAHGAGARMQFLSGAASGI